MWEVILILWTKFRVKKWINQKSKKYIIRNWLKWITEQIKDN